MIFSTEFDNPKNLTKRSFFTGVDLFDNILMQFLSTISLSGVTILSK